MASPTMQKLRGLLRRGPVTASIPASVPAEVEPPAAPASLERGVAQLAADVERLKVAQQAIEAKVDALAARDPAAAATASTPPADFRKIEAAIAALQARVAEILATQASAAIAAQRNESAIGGLRDGVGGLAARVGKLDQEAARDRKRLEASTAGAREVQEAIARSTEELERARDELGDRAEELGRRLALRLAPLYLLSLVALLAALATLGLVFWKL